MSTYWRLLDEDVWGFYFTYLISKRIIFLFVFIYVLVLYICFDKQIVVLKSANSSTRENIQRKFQKKKSKKMTDIKDGLQSKVQLI